MSAWRPFNNGAFYSRTLSGCTLLAHPDRWAAYRFEGPTSEADAGGEAESRLDAMARADQWATANGYRPERVEVVG